MNKEQLINQIVKSVMKALSEEKPLTLQEAWQRDQAERADYHDNHLKPQNGNWQAAAQSYRKSKNIPEGQPIFTDYTSHAKNHLNTTPPENLNHEDWTALWGIAQHADHDTDFQKQTLKLIEEHKGKDWKTNEKNQNSAHEYLSDRIAVNEGKEQQHGTQTGA
jgi:hypothetical protein